MRRSWWGMIAALVGIWGVCPTVAWSATISGRVTSDGKPVEGAWVQLNVGLLTKTDKNGRYTLPPIPKATYAAQVIAPGKRPLVVGGIIAGKGKADFALEPAASPFGIVHVTPVRTDRGAPCPVRIVTRWRAVAEGEFASLESPQFASTVDLAGRPVVPDEASSAWIVPSGACLWSRGEAVLAAPPGQVELTCTSGILMGAVQTTIDVVADQQAEAPVSLAPGAAGSGLGWTCGAIGCRVALSAGAARYAVNLPLAATILRAEGYDWAAVVVDAGRDSEQGEPRQVAGELSDEGFQLWIAGEVGDTVLGRQIVLAPRSADAADTPTPGYYRAASSRKTAAIFSGLARQLPFDISADPSVVPVIDLDLSGSSAEQSAELWALLLAHGYRVGAASLTRASMSDGRLPVSDRTFVQIEGELTLAGVVEGLARGTTWASTGPVVTLAVDEALPGEALPAGDATRIASLDAWMGCVPGGGVTRMELVRLGRVVRTWGVADVGANHVTARIAVRDRDSAWYSLRATGTAGGGATLPLVAQTSAVYITGATSTVPRPMEVSISGRVLDAATQAPVAGARVKATPPTGKSVTVTSGADGSYRLTTSATALLEASHPRSGSAVRFVAWHSQEVAPMLRSAPLRSLLDWRHYQNVREAATAPVVDLPLAKP